MRITVGLAIFLGVLLPVTAQDNKDDVFTGNEDGFAIRKPADKRAKDNWEFDTKNLGGSAVLRIKNKVVLGMTINLSCLRAQTTQSFDLDKQADGLEDNIKKSADKNWQSHKKKQSRTKTKWFTGENACSWIYEFVAKNNDEFEDHIYMWISKTNNNLYVVEAFTPKGDWEKYGKQIEEMLRSLVTFRPKKSK